jgi:phosphohistidine phosphatase
MLMNKKLYILRHAKSDWEDLSLSDFERPLNKRGSKNAPAMGVLLKSMGVLPQLIISSSAVRAKTTIELVAKEMGYDINKIEFKKELYMASANDSFMIIRDTPEDIKSLMIVGHNSGITDLLNRLAGGRDHVQNIPTCGLAELHFKGEWARMASGKFLLKNFLTPRGDL